MNNWLLAFHSFDPKQEGIRESLCTLGNGYFALRGAFEESEADEIHYPGTYLAGGYNRLKSRIHGKEIENEDLVNFPNALPLTFKIGDGPYFNVRDVELLSFQQTLDLRKGILSRKISFRYPNRHPVHFSIRRIVSMDDPHVAAIEMSLCSEEDEEIEILSALDGRIENEGVKRYADLNRKHLKDTKTQADKNTLFLKTVTNQSEIHMALAARTRLFIRGKEIKPITEIRQELSYIGTYFRLKLLKGQTLTVEKVISLHTSRDRALSECGRQVQKEIKELGSFKELLKKHTVALKYLWQIFDITIDCDSPGENISRLLRLHIFHLLQTTSVHSQNTDSGVPPRGWHGEAYRGHILWDETFIFAVLNLKFPELTKTFLLYRFRRLSEARNAARSAGLQGAMYPWQSGSDGREESQKIHLNPRSGRWIPDNSYLQRHVNGAIAYNVWQYYEATKDLEFLSLYGAEMLLEIARFWVSLSSYNRAHDRYEICGVMGPDEYHEGYPGKKKPGINNNAYTNLIAAWVLARIPQVMQIIPKEKKKELYEKLELSEKELLSWEKMRKKFYIPFHDGVISQFEGYEKLKELDWEAYKKKYRDIQRMDRILESENDNVNNYKVSKQADVLMLFYLFPVRELQHLFQETGYELSEKTIQKTIDYYRERTSLGSTLGKLVHSWVVARFDREASLKLFYEALQSDFADVQHGTTAEGIHLGVMAGTVDLIQRCYCGIEFHDNALYFNPIPPKSLKKCHFKLRYRKNLFSVRLTQKKLFLLPESLSGEAIQIFFRDKICECKEGVMTVFSL